MQKQNYGVGVIQQLVPDVAPAHEAQDMGNDAEGCRVFDPLLDHQIHQPAHVQLYTGDWAWKDCPKNLPRTKEFRFPEDLWMSEDAARVVPENPFAGDAVQMVTIHLITAEKYKGGELYIWLPGKEGRTIQATGEDNFGPFYEVELQADEQHLFLFKFIDEPGNYEPDYANRLWVAQDRGEIWVHSQASAISTTEPKKKSLIIHARQFNISARLHIHLWQEDSDFTTTIENGIVQENNWIRFEHPVYTGRPYRFMFYSPSLEDAWEDKEAVRTVLLAEDGAVRHMRNWWNRLTEIRRDNSRLEGPAPLRVTFAQEGMLAFTRGEGNDLFILLNFSPWAGWRSLMDLNLPDGDCKELLNSTWGSYRVEGEDEHSNGGWDTHLYQGQWLHIPDYGVVVLERR